MGVFYNPRIITDGLVLYLDAANPKSYPGTGDQWIDLSPSKVDFTLYGGYSFADNSIDMDGVDGTYASTPTSFISTGQIGTGNIGYSIEAMCMYRTNPGSISVGYSIIGNASGTGIGLQIAAFGGNILPTFGYRSNSNFYGVTPLVSGEWFHIIATKIADSDSMIYLNGVLDYTYTTGTYMDIDDTTAAMSIGTAAGRIKGFFDGQFSFIKLYNKTLSQAEVTQNFNAHRGKFGL
tara:strand:- start:171 stop:875 length:705 start_codon:yes stop_codon:yes gene_type:complete